MNPVVILTFQQVFDDRNDLNEKLQSTLCFFTTKGSDILKVKFSPNRNGEEWVEQEVSNNLFNLQEIDGCYITFEISGKAFDISDENIILSVIIENGYYGFLLDINWGSLFPMSDNQQNVENRSRMLLNFAIELHSITNYDYATIGHELEIEHSPNDFKNLIKETDCFSIAIVDEGDNLMVYKGSFSIDGIT